MRLGWSLRKNESNEDAMLRAQAVSALIRLGDSHVQQEAVKRFEMFVKKPSTLPADLREPVYSAYAWVKNSPAAYAKLERMYKNATSQEEKQRFFIISMFISRQKSTLENTKPFLDISGTLTKYAASCNAYSCKPKR